MRRLVVGCVCAGALLMATPVLAGPDTPAKIESPPAVAVQRVAVPTSGLRDEAAMVLVGSVLIGVAAAVRRAA
jgi:hypothetical protein